MTRPGRPSNKDKWLKKRQSLITASDCAAILGLDPWRGPLTVWAEKRGLIETPDNDAMLFGRLLEDDAAEGYHIKTGRKIIPWPEYEVAICPSIPWLGATFDRKTEESALEPRPQKDLNAGPVPLQCKAPGIQAKNDWTHADEPPIYYQIQVQIEILVAAQQWGSIAALIGGQLFRWADLVRNQEFLDVAIPKLDAFRLSIQKNEPPLEDTHPSRRETLRVLYAEDNGESVELGEEILKVARRLDLVRAIKRKRDAQIDELESEIIAALGEAAVGMLPDGSFITARTQHIQERSQIVKAHTRRPIRWKKGSHE